MKGLGSQLCDHLVKKVIYHLENEINPRIKQFERLSFRKRNELGRCGACNTPFERDSDKVKKCQEHFGCIISCGEIWCKPNICKLCNNEMCCFLDCDVNGCKEHPCATCSDLDCCNCIYCYDHRNEKVLNLANHDDFRNCFIKETICIDCSHNTAICSNCNEECKMTDIADVIDIKDCPHPDHTQCGRAICKNCTDNKRIKL